VPGPVVTGDPGAEPSPVAAPRSAGEPPPPIGELAEPSAGGRRAIARGGAWSNVGWLVTNACGALNTILLVRSMSRSEYGIFVMATSSMAIVSSVAAFGLAPAVVVLSPRAGAGGARTVLRHARTLSLVMGALAAVVSGTACLALGLDGYRELAVVLGILIPTAVAAPFVSSLIGFLQTVQQPKRLALSLLVPPLVLTAIVITLSSTTHPAAAWVAAARSLAALLGLGFLALAVRRAHIVGRSPVPAKTGGEATLRQLTALGASLLGGTIAAVFLAQFDVLILGFARGRAIVALYGPASLVADNALTMAATVGAFYVATIAAVLSRNEVGRAGELYRWASRWALVWVAPVVAVMLACPRATLTLLFGAPYATMSTPLRILAGGVLVNMVFGFNGPTVDSLNRVRLIVGRQAVALVFNVAACAVLVPAFGASGAAIATSSSLVVINVTASVLLYKQTRITPNNPKLFAVTATLGMAVAVGLLAGEVSMASALLIALVAAVALAVCGTTSYLVSNASERQAIKNGLRRLLAKVAPGSLSGPAV
jgi:O-antigen/teichoic acid export membrane protein